MQIINAGKKNLDTFKGRVNKLPGLVWIEKDTDPADALTEDGDINHPWIKKTMNQYNEYYKGTIDLTNFYIDSADWTRDGSFGVNLGKTYNGSQICIVKRRRRWYDTAEHEFWHAINDYIYIHTGIRLDTVFNVADFDEDIVHARAPGREEYEYDDLYDKVEPYFVQAVKNDNNAEFRALLFKTRAMLRKRVVQLQSQVEEL